MNDKAKEVMDFMEKHPEFKGKFVGYKKSRGGLGITRIDDDWYECEDYYISMPDLYEALKTYKKKEV